MTFDQFANQGDTAAWDPEAAAATKKAADKIFNPRKNGTNADGTDSSDTEKTVGTDGDEDEPKQNPEPGDPDITLDP